MTEILALKTIKETKKERKKKEIENYVKKHKPLKKYLDTLTPETAHISALVIMRYCDIMEKNPTELCQHSSPQEREQKRYDGEKLFDEFEDHFLEWRKNNPNNPSLTISVALKMAMSVRAMYRVNKIDLARDAGRRIKKMAPLTWDTYTPNQEDIRHYRDAMTRFRDKLLVHLVSVMPLRQNEVRQLRWDDLQGFPSDEYPYVILGPHRLKAKRRGIWFVGVVSETVKDDLLKWQKQQKALYKKFNEKWLPSCPIFTTYRRTKGRFGMISKESLKLILQKATNEVLSKHGFRMTLQDFRRYFETQIEIARQHGIAVSKKYSYWFLGHKLEGVEFHYNQVEPNISLIIELFKELEPFIDIDCTRPRVTKWDKLSKENEELREQIEELKYAIKESKK